MPDYFVTNPEGKRFRVTAPEGATQDEIIAYAQSQFQKPDLRKTNPAEYDPSSSEYQEKYGALSKSDFQNARAGFGKAFVDLGRGAKQLSPSTFTGPAGLIKAGIKKFQGVEDERDIAARKAQDEVNKRDAALMGTKAGIAGNITGNVAAALPTMFVPGVNTYTGAGLVGAGLGALQPVGTNQSRTQNMALGAAGGMAGKYVGGKIGDWASKARQRITAPNASASASGGSSNAAAGVSGSIDVHGTGGGVNFGSVGDDPAAAVSNSQRRLIDVGNRLGLKVTPGQASGSKALQQLEAKLESQPMTSGPFNQIKADNAKGITRAFLKAIGEEGDEASADVLARADARIGSVFERAAQNNKTAYDDVFQASLADIEAAASNELSSSEMGIVRKQFENILNKASDGGGLLNGRQYQNIRESLSRLSGNASTGVGYWARQIRDSLDDALARSSGDRASAQLRTARDQYRILATAMNRTGTITQSGTVQPGLLANAISQSDKRGYMLGRNSSDLYEALRFGQAFRPIVGDSGTSTRAPIAGAFDFLARIPYNIAARAYTSSPSVTAASYAGPLARGAGNATRNVLGTAPFYAPYALPGAGASVTPLLGE